jgi:ADP-ribose pyrophosphatase YjhB (NUDIX family)
MFKYCPKCGRRFTKKRLHGRTRLYCRPCDFFFFQNSKPTASAIITKGKKILLTKRSINPKKGWWDTPGGFLENGEHPLVGVKREMKEELGLEIIPIKLLTTVIDYYIEPPNYRFYTLNLFYLSKIKKGRIRPADDVCEAKWFSKNNLPKKIAFKNSREALRDWKKMS